MAFNFNWSPLMADAGFYTRAQELLTAALNKSPKPPIIVGDITVTELNLGSIPPDLEILEIGDLADDRFRGIFKMSYSGDAYLTLKTCVQANSLNTYMVTRPSFTSPCPLAADHGLTIPLQITLSDIKLSGFVVLVFSKQKGITLVFRNDPLESLKVSSTFDSIPFVRDYLQRTIEGQLRLLFMDELPAIIHRLSLRLWVPELRGQDVETQADEEVGPGQDPLLSPPQDPVDASGNVLSVAQIASLSLDSGVEMHSLFSQRNLVRLATLTDSQRTLSLFTPTIHDVVFRALTGAMEQSEYHGGLISPASPPLSRTHSHAASLQSLQESSMSKASLGSPLSGYSSLTTSAGCHPRARPSRKHKRRVVDLRKSKKSDDTSSTCTESEYTVSTDASTVFSSSARAGEKTDDPITPPISPDATIKVKDRSRVPAVQGLGPPVIANPAQPTPSAEAEKKALSNGEPSHIPRQNTPTLEAHQQGSDNTTSLNGIPPSVLSFVAASQDRSILEQAWMMKLANEISRRIQESKGPGSVGGASSYCGHQTRDPSPPPAYGQ
ncbi:Mitochondrial distribution and morphology protein 34 [Trichophyton interdigitale]|nr:Mitochondrial distribution and morphology protein 34 [Trichophyton interdigitale]KAG5218906.1 Mitochondrial distribution and morphology protein 34 [Trichophyton interdigitale]KAG8209764.1 Mitochondrial distribution and morphology protein 34 [Trichophyton interdigitale]